MNISIKKVMVLLSSSADKVILETELPCPYAKAYLPGQPPLDLKFETSYDTGIQYVRDNFGLEPDVVNVRVLNK